MLSLDELKDRLAKRSEAFKRYDLQSKIDSCQDSIAFHSKKEKEYRAENNWHMVRYCKKKRKEKQSDLKYYLGELQKLD